MTPLLEAQGLSKSYGGVQALRDVSFTVAAGEMVALIGANGAGKSTCYNVLSGQVRPDAGEVRLDGEPLAGLGPPARARRGIGRTFQVAAVFGSMTVAENVETACAAAPVPVASTGSLLDKVGLGDVAGRAAAAMAYGDVKRLELALALAGGPKLLLMDEPTAGMAAGERGALMALVRAIADAERVGVLFTEHDMEVVFAHADRILVFSRGRLIADGAPDTVRADPAVRRDYLGGVA